MTHGLKHCDSRHLDRLVVMPPSRPLRAGRHGALIGLAMAAIDCGELSRQAIQRVTGGAKLMVTSPQDAEVTAINSEVVHLTAWLPEFLAQDSGHWSATADFRSVRHHPVLLGQLNNRGKLRFSDPKMFVSANPVGVTGPVRLLI